jgi:hypothetical protein
MLRADWLKTQGTLSYSTIFVIAMDTLSIIEPLCPFLRKQKQHKNTKTLALKLSLKVN